MKVLVKGSLNLEKCVHPRLVIPNRDTIDLVSYELIVGQDEYIVDEKDIPFIEDVDMLFKRSQKAKGLTIPDDYEVYLQKHEFDVSDYSMTYEEAICSSPSNFWLDAMKDEMKSMTSNVVWDFVELLEGCKRIGCKWVFTTKQGFKGQTERYKAKLITKWFSKKEGIDCT